MTPTAHVASFLFKRADAEHDVLIGIRRASTNARHPGVVSVPTFRVPPELHEAARQDVPRKAGRAAPIPGEHEAQGRFGVPGAGATTSGFLTESLLARKLELAVELESGEVQGSCSPWLHLETVVDDPLGTRENEFTSMITIGATWIKGAALAEKSTVSYERLAWVDGRLLVEAWDKNDAQMLYPDRDPWSLCISGLCIRSAVELIRRASHHSSGNDDLYRG